MVYKMYFYVDGGCRRNGHNDAYGAAAAIWVKKWGKQKSWTVTLPRYDDPRPTSQRAEIMALILALEQALKHYETLAGYPEFELVIHSDSQFVVNCMDLYIPRWFRNGWVNARGYEVANRDLLEEASDLEDEVNSLGSVRYQWIPRSENVAADQLANDAMDDMEDSEEDSEEYLSDDVEYYLSDSDSYWDYH